MSENPSIPEEILLLAHRLRTQDNRITGEPLFLVQQKERRYGFDPNYADCSTFRVWHSEDWECVYDSAADLTEELERERKELIDEEPTEKQKEKFEEQMQEIRDAWDNGEDVTTPEGLKYEVCFYQEHWDFVSAHFTEAAADHYLASNSHHFKHGARVYVTSQYRCYEWNAVRKFLMGFPTPSEER
jgi:hypothetical protein